MSNNNLEEPFDDTLNKSHNNAIQEKSLIDLTSLETNRSDSNHDLDFEIMTHLCHQNKSNEEK